MLIMNSDRLCSDTRDTIIFVDQEITQLPSPNHEIRHCCPCGPFPRSAIAAAGFLPPGPPNWRPPMRPSLAGPSPPHRAMTI